MKKWVLLLVVFIILFQLAACGHAQSIEIPIFDAKKSVYLSDKAKADIRSVLLMADNQFNFYFTDPIVLRNRAADFISHVAIRPPQLDLFAEDLLDWILSKHASDKYVIHLGDATNIACVSEWKRFAKVMSKSRESPAIKGWVMAPGNHDAYLYGVTGGGWNKLPLNNVGLQWAKACSTKWPIDNAQVNIDNDQKYQEWRLTKNALLDAYIDQIIKQQEYHPEDFNFDDLSGTQLPEEYQTFCNGNEVNCTLRLLKAKREEAFVQKLIYVKYSSPKPSEKDFDYGDQHKSFMVQQLNLSTNTSGKKTYAILVDTVDYSQVPSNVRGALCGKLFNSSCGINAGTTGMISDLQKKIVERFISDIEKQDAYYVLMGHHPIGQKGDNPLEKKTSKWLLEETSKKFSLGYISAHTHYGYVQEKNFNKKASIENHQEINIGSATDWPIEVRTLENGTSEGVLGKSILSRLIRIGGADLPQVEECSALHNYSSTKNYDYVSYHLGNWKLNTALIEHEKTLDTLLVTYIRLFRDLKVTPPSEPSGAKEENENSFDPIITGLVKEAEEKIKSSCTKGDKRKSDENDSESCRKTKRDLAMCMWRIDRWLQGEKQASFPLNDLQKEQECSKKMEKLNPITGYTKSRHNYGVCQAVWASQTEFIFTKNERNVLKSLTE